MGFDLLWLMPSLERALPRSDLVLRFPLPRCAGCSTTLAGRLLDHVGNPRQPSFAREIVHRLEKTLQAFEAFFALDSEQGILMSLPRPLPPAGNQNSVVADIFLSNESKARLLDESLIDSRRHEEKHANGAPEGQFIVGDRPGNDNRIGEKRPTPVAKD